MTVYINLSSLAWAALAALFVVRYADVWVARLFAQREHKFEPHTADGVGTPIPDDLLALVNTMSTGASESDELLRQQTVALLYEKCAEFGGDWDKVRGWSAVNIASDTRADGWGHS